MSSVLAISIVIGAIVMVVLLVLTLRAAGYLRRNENELVKQDLEGIIDEGLGS